jgi:hypothetical protein
LVNNINLAQCATSEFKNAGFNTNLKLFVHRLFASKRQALPKQTVADDNDLIRFSRKIILPSDHIVMNHLHNIHFFHGSLYETCWKKNVQFTIYDPNSTTKTSDSCILFKTHQSEVNCGFIVGIISTSKQQCNLTIHEVQIDQEDSITYKNKYIVNPFIFWGQLTDPPHLITIDIQDILVKIAYSKVKDTFHFYQYPNTAEST